MRAVRFVGLWSDGWMFACLAAEEVRGFLWIDGEAVIYAVCPGFRLSGRGSGKTASDGKMCRGSTSMNVREGVST